MVAKDKLLAEGGLSETKVILGWLVNFQMLTVSLPDHKFIAWTAAIQKMITSKRTTSKDLETTIGRMGHVGFVIPWVYHFLSRLRSLHYRSKNRLFITVNDTCMKDLELMKEILEKAKNGIDMNLLAFRSPDRIYYSDSCPHGLGGYSAGEVASVMAVSAVLDRLSSALARSRATGVEMEREARRAA